MAIFEQGAAVLGSWLGGFSPKAGAIGNLGDFFFFRYILGYLSDKIHDLGFDMLTRVSQYAGYLALTVLTLYIFFQGYRVVTGQLRESMMGLVANMAKAAFIVAVALSFGVLGSSIHEFLVNDMKNGIFELVTGNTGGSPEEEIDDSLGWLQVAMSSIDLLEAVNDPDLVAEKENAKFYVGIGTGGPAITAGAMLLLYEIAMALFIGLGPIFILSLLFEFTKGLFQKWLFYGIGTMFSMAMLAAMVSIALDMVTRVSGAMWASSAVGQLLLGENVVGGMNSMAMQQGGMGLILTTLIITAPPMAAMFFNGVLGQFSAYATVGAHLNTAQPQMGAYSGGSAGGYAGGYQPTMPGRMGETARTERDQMGDFHAAQAAQAPMYSTGPGGTASNTSPSPSGLGPGTRGAGNTQQQSAPIDTPTSPAGTEARGSQANYAPENPGARGAANAAPAGAPQYTPPPSSGGAPTPAPPQNAPPVSSSTRVAGSPSTQTPGPTYTPPPPPKDRG